MSKKKIDVLKFVMYGKKYGKALNLTQTQLYVMVVVVKKKAQFYLVRCVKPESA